MRIVIATTCDLNMYPAQFFLACALARQGAEVTVLSKVKPVLPVPGGKSATKPAWLPVEQMSGLLASTPILHADYHGVLRHFSQLRPHWIIAQHGQVMSALLYKAIAPRCNPVKVAGYFADYIEKAWWLPILKQTAGKLDCYIDVCDMRLAWRNEDWPRLQAPRFVVRNAPPSTLSRGVTPHRGPAKLVFTGRNYGQGTRSDLLARFFRRLCEHGIETTWFLPGTPEERESVSSQVNDERFVVRAAVGKEELASELAKCDVGLLWTPTTETQNRESRTNYVSAASNKLGEYLAAGLALLHTGNPGLRFLPDDCALAVDPWYPEESADQLAPILADRTRLEAMRRAALAFHQSVLNAEKQTEPLVSFMFSSSGCALLSDTHSNPSTLIG